MWTEYQPLHIDAWWDRASYSVDAAERKACLEKTVELCTDERTKFRSFLRDRRKAALKLLGRKS